MSIEGDLGDPPHICGRGGPAHVHVGWCRRCVGQTLEDLERLPVGRHVHAALGGGGEQILVTSAETEDLVLRATVVGKEVGRVREHVRDGNVGTDPSAHVQQ